MLESPGILTTLIAFLLLLGPLVVVHELGHYIVARWFGVKADAFSVGFGKELAGWTDRRGTRWKLSAIPLGGYVQFAGDMNPASMPGEVDESLTPAERAELFQFKPLWQRSLIVFAGPLTNLLLAVAVYAAFNMAYGRIVTHLDVTGYASHSDAQAAGVRIGDRIVAVDGDKLESQLQLSRLVAPYPGETVNLSVLRDGREIAIPVKLRAQSMSDPFGNHGTVADLGLDFAKPVVGHIIEGSAAEVAGLQIGDRILAVDGETVRSFIEIAEYVKPRPGRTVSLTVLREGRELAVPVTLATETDRDDKGEPVEVGRMGIYSDPGEAELVDLGPVESVTLAWSQSIGVVRIMASGIGQIITGARSVKELSGPVRMAKFSGETLSLGWQNFVSFIAFVSINLAFINLLPIPALDGGHLAFYAAEAVRRRPLGMRSQEWAFRTGLAFVLALMVFVTINDLASLPIFGG